METMPLVRVRSTGALVATALVGLFVSLGLPGCGAGDKLPRQAISGTVTLGSSPLPKGTIQFLPTVSGPTADPGNPDSNPAAPNPGATAASVPITDGKFMVDRAQGLVPGPYKVQVYGADFASAAADAPPGLEPPQPKETIPRRYNTATTLTAEVKAEGPNTFEFQLTK